MGCSNSSNSIRYNYHEPTDVDKDSGIKPLDSGPFKYNDKTTYENLYFKCKDLCIWDYFKIAFPRFATKPAVGYREMQGNKPVSEGFTNITYSELYTFSQKMAVAMRKANLHNPTSFPEEGDTKLRIVGLFARNCLEWLVTDLACMADSVTNATFYSTLGEEAFQHIANFTELTTIFISPDNIAPFCHHKSKEDLPYLKNVVVFDYSLEITDEQLDQLHAFKDLQILSFKALIADVTQEEIASTTLDSPTGDTLLSICFTSGTTGLPKGVKVTQRMLASCLNGINSAGITYTEDERHVSFLPLAHIMERSLYIAMFMNGCYLAFVPGDVRKNLAEYIGLVKPTFFIAVPKLLSNFKEKIFNKFAQVTGCKKSLVERALRVKKEQFAKTGNYSHSFYDRLVFSKVTGTFGGCIKYFVCGSAPLPEELANDIKILFSCPIVEGYGMTETTGGAFCTNFNDVTNGHVGGPVEGVIAKLEGVKELDYTNATKTGGIKTPCGEICIKGPICTPGYFRDEKNTKELIDADGWLHTGDIGKMLPSGKIKVIDRRKEIFKLSQGEYIAPSKLEAVYGMSDFVSQLCIYGDSTKNHVLGIVYPNVAELAAEVRRIGIKLEKDEDVLKMREDKRVLEIFVNDFDALHKEGGLNGLEKCPKIIISPEEFNHDKNKLLTPTQKMVRKKIKEFFEAEIKKAYA